MKRRDTTLRMLIALLLPATMCVLAVGGAVGFYAYAFRPLRSRAEYLQRRVALLEKRDQRLRRDRAALMAERAQLRRAALQTGVAVPPPSTSVTEGEALTAYGHVAPGLASLEDKLARMLRDSPPVLCGSGATRSARNQEKLLESVNARLWGLAHAAGIDELTISMACSQNNHAEVPIARCDTDPYPMYSNSLYSVRRGTRQISWGAFKSAEAGPALVIDSWTPLGSRRLHVKAVYMNPAGK